LVHSALSSTLSSNTVNGASRTELIVLRALLLAAGARLSVLSPQFVPAAATAHASAAPALSTDPLLSIFEFLDMHTLFSVVARVNRCWFSCVMGCEPRRNVWRRVHNLRLDVFLPAAVSSAATVTGEAAAATATTSALPLAALLPAPMFLAVPKDEKREPIAASAIPALPPSPLTIFFHKLSQLTVLVLGADVTDQALASFSYGSAATHSSSSSSLLPSSLSSSALSATTASPSSAASLPSPFDAPCVLLPHLHTLSLRNCTHITDRGVCHVRFPSLTCVDLSGTAVADTGLTVVVRFARANLRTLRLNDCASVTAVGMESVACFCPRLQVCVVCARFFSFVFFSI
jgi:hypothetical protein